MKAIHTMVLGVAMICDMLGCGSQSTAPSGQQPHIATSANSSVTESIGSEGAAKEDRPTTSRPKINTVQRKEPIRGSDGGVTAGLASWLQTETDQVRPALPPPKKVSEVAVLAEPLAVEQVRLWNDAAFRQRGAAEMRLVNPEWDFMGRSFVVWALANRSLRHPELKAEYLRVIDRIIDDAIKTEHDQGIYYFLMHYARTKPFVVQPPRSLFLDGEIALMLAARRLVEEKEAYRQSLADRVGEIVRRMERGPVMCAESYPDECWMFCNTIALAAIRLSDKLDGTDHSAFFRKWVSTANEKLVDRQTGLLVSAFSLDGHVIQGPRGSSIWMAAHCLQLIDEPFAADQYRRAKKELASNLPLVGYAREWPASSRHRADVDSGAVVPGFDASASSSGLALVAARTFDDRGYFRSLQTSLSLFAAPEKRSGHLRYSADSQLGDAVILYAATLGPLWEKARK